MDQESANAVASAMKTWAMQKGATHYCHWFQPLTGTTAEKHDAFFDLTGEGGVLETFTGLMLSQAEPDASSFPSGGLRATFEARGYTAWDPTSPAFILEVPGGSTLCIPTIFVSYTGHALDTKTPLLRSIDALNKAALGILTYFKSDAAKVVPTLGAEQEYFLIDEEYFNARPDLLLSGRTLFGAPSPKGQQLEDHYFGSIKERVFAFMTEAEGELYKLGVPIKTRHNEVAPNQFECAPIFEEANVAVDHNQLVMDVMKRVAARHGLAALVYEKPFAGVNGSGKHNNWSLGTDTGKNLLSPGATPQENLQFLIVLVSIVKAVYDHSLLLRASIASSGNDHRLGANEAPPAIMSVFLGAQLTNVLNDLEKGATTKAADPEWIPFGIDKIPPVIKDNTDRNRTSPFAFTGNKFEFRAVGAAFNNAVPVATLNTIVAGQLIETKKRDRRGAQGRQALQGRRRRGPAQALQGIEGRLLRGQQLLRGVGQGGQEARPAQREDDAGGAEGLRAQEVRRAVREAPRADPRGIALALPHPAREVREGPGHRGQARRRDDDDAVRAGRGGLPERAGESAVSAAKEAGVKTPAQSALLRSVAEKIEAALEGVDELSAALAKADAIADVEAKAAAYCESVKPHFEKIRAQVDALELLMPSAAWPVPKYREMLFLM